MLATNTDSSTLSEFDPQPEITPTGGLSREWERQRESATLPVPQSAKGEDSPTLDFPEMTKEL